MSDTCTRCHHHRFEHGQGEAKTGGTRCAVVTYTSPEGVDVTCACGRFTLRDDAGQPVPFAMFTVPTPFRLFKRQLP